MSDMDVGIAALALYIYSELSDENKKKKKRGSVKGRKWSRGWLTRRHLYTHENLLNDRLTEPADFKNCLRVDCNTFDQLLKLVTPYIEKKNTVMREAIPVSQRLSATLVYFASGLSFERLKFITCISPQSLSIIVMETCDALIKALKDYIKLPTNEDEWKQVVTEYLKKWDFAHCIGAIDGKHVDIRKPFQSGSTYYNYKQRFSIVLLGLVNAYHEFLTVDVGINGRISNGGVLHHNEFGKALCDYKLNLPCPEKLPKSDTTAPYVMVADDAFMLHVNMMKPYPHTSLNKREIVFNKRLSRARHTIEDTFDIGIEFSI